MKSSILKLFQAAGHKLALKDHRSAIRNLTMPAMGVSGGLPTSEAMAAVIALRMEQVDLCAKLGIPAGPPPKMANQTAAEIKAQESALNIGNAEMHRQLNQRPTPHTKVASVGYKSRKAGRILNPKLIAVVKEREAREDREAAAKVAATTGTRSSAAKQPTPPAKAARPAVHAPMPSAEAIAAAMLDEQQRRATAPLSRAEFSKLTPAAKMAFVKAGRQITA
jgi:hypothetical protein